MSKSRKVSSSWRLFTSGMNIPCSKFDIQFLTSVSAYGLAIASLICAGCGGTHESSVTGIVYLDDKPLTTGNVTFHPEQGGAAVYSRIGADGAYTLRTGSEEGLKPGEYKVTVMATDNPPAAAPGQAPPIGTPITPIKYGRRETTDLVKTVEPGENNIDLRLTSP
jgi:hypothetical protein